MENKDVVEKRRLRKILGQDTVYSRFSYYTADDLLFD
jgi:hypothetical protein